MAFYNCILIIMPYESSVKSKRGTHAVYRSHSIYILWFNYYGTCYNVNTHWVISCCYFQWQTCKNNCIYQVWSTNMKLSTDHAGIRHTSCTVTVTYVYTMLYINTRWAQYNTHWVAPSCWSQWQICWWHSSTAVLHYQPSLPQWWQYHWQAFHRWLCRWYPLWPSAHCQCWRWHSGKRTLQSEGRV